MLKLVARMRLICAALKVVSKKVVILPHLDRLHSGFNIRADSIEGHRCWGLGRGTLRVAAH